ncbi:hypothetical protein K503DRAFT_172120 [Rhizopogon vinicolor AM-OR11-026]|uniref:Uncharacterized protein n=1 Tax=Rhizopogon vinicolor AM-OR11-026 TaxID=1314800 RepID=A0A1B7N081_9AGAM|nr:hypothetical protein K503DRAFT_172120 [Rhizopogon vinicolor AM-OR11-026]
MIRQVWKDCRFYGRVLSAGVLHKATSIKPKKGARDPFGKQRSLFVRRRIRARSTRMFCTCTISQTVLSSRISYRLLHSFTQDTIKDSVDEVDASPILRW